MGISNQPDLQNGTSVGQYTIKRRIGAGGMGEVYEAEHVGLAKRVAIKTLRRQFTDNEVVVARFLREGQLASRIRHPHIVDVTDVGVIDGLPCLVMEYLEGESLHTLLRREKSLDLAKLIDIMLPVLAAVDAAHQQGVVHRDLKPANIFLARGLSDVIPKVLDFGISKVVQDQAPAELTTDSTFLGSPFYVSPEVARGDRNVDARSDQYSLGVILYEGACGVRPFAQRADTFMALMFAIAQGDFPPPHVHRPGLPMDFERVVLRAMARSRGDRFPSVGALARAVLPFASPRSRTIWEPAFMSVSAPLEQGATAPDLPRAPFEETGGAISRSAHEGTGTAARPHPLGMLWWSLAGAVALLAGVGVALGASRAVVFYKNGEGPPAREGEVEAANAGPQSYQVKLDASPANALIELDGRSTTVGTFSASFSKLGHGHTLEVSADGYETRTIVFDAKSPPPAHVELEKLEPQHAKPGPHPAPALHKAPAASASGKPKLETGDPWSGP
jgi:eukaryotic-like serine/threonine-protein kinase